MSLDHTETYQFSDFELNVRERRLCKDGVVVPLSDKVFQTLCILAMRGGSLVTKGELSSAVWPDTIVEDNNLDKCISKLRSALEEKAGNTTFIETVRGHGWRFLPAVSSFGGDTGGYRRNGHDQVSNGGAEAKAATPFGRDSIAVMAFKNLSSDPDNDYFCEGLADELINALSKTGDLTVAARSSAFFFKDKNAELNEIGSALNVRTILEGSVSKSLDRLRIIVRLANASDGYSIWSERYDRQVRDIFDIQDEIALAVVDALNVKLFGKERDALLKRFTANTDAYLLYLRGQFHRWRSTPRDFAHALKYFEQAIEADPSFALGHFGLSTYYGYGTAWGLLPISPEKGWPLAEAAAQRAFELDNSLPELQLSFAAFALVNHRRSAEAGAQMAAIAAANPRFPEIHHAYSFYLLTVGRFDEALVEARMALALDPLSGLFSRFIAICLYFADRKEQSIDQLIDTLELEPNNPVTYDILGEVYLKMGKTDDAVDAWLSSARINGDAEFVSILESAGAIQAKAQAIGDTLQRRFDQRSETGDYVPSVHRARASLMAAKTDDAFAWLDKAVDERNVFPLLMNGDPFWDSLRSDLRFELLLQRI